jgi:hypothetical protein
LTEAEIDLMTPAPIQAAPWVTPLNTADRYACRFG